MARPKKRKFFIVGASNRRAAGFEIHSQVRVRGLRDRCGFPEFPEPPRLVIDNKLGNELTDMEPYGSYWIVSALLKAVLEEIDPGSVVFCELDVTHKDGANPEQYWLCDVVRVIDAIDERASVLDVTVHRDGRKYYSLYSSRLVFNPVAVEDVHLFRDQRNTDIFCDETFKSACRCAGVNGMSFAEVKTH